MRDLTVKWNNLSKFGEFAMSISGFIASLQLHTTFSHLSAYTMLSVNDYISSYRQD